MASGEGQSNPSTSGDAGGDHHEDFGNEYGPPLPTQEELREMEHRRLVGEATNLMLNFAKDPKLAKYMSETAFQDVQAQLKATTTSPPKPDSKKQYSEKELEEEIDARLARILGAQKQGKKHDRKRKKSTDFPGYLGSQSTFDKAKHKKRAAMPSSSSSSDNIIVFSKNEADHRDHLLHIFQAFLPEIHFLGHIVSAAGVQMDPAKIEAIRNWPDLKNVHEVRSFLGLCSYYRRYVRKFAEIASPLHMLTQKGVPFSWGVSEVTAFQTLKDKMTTGPVLIMPYLQKSFEVYCDACGRSLGAVLMQEGQVIAYESQAAFGEADAVGEHLVTVSLPDCPCAGQKNVVADALSRKPLVQAISAIHHNFFEDMIDQYATDTDFADIFTRIRDGESVEGYSLREGYLMRKTMLCVTQPLRKKVMTECHCPPYTGHRGIATTMKGVERYFYWPRLKKDVEEFVRGCLVFTSGGICLQQHDTLIDEEGAIPNCGRCYEGSPFLSTKDKILEANEYTRDLDKAFAKVRETLQKSQERQKKAADRHRRDLKLKENDWVLLRFEKARLRKKKGKEKLIMRYYGPFQITEQINDVSFRLRLPDTWKIHNVFHVNLWKTFGDVHDDGEPDKQPEVEENEEILVPE
ncbi:hypothetical protein L7F22_011092 [Adiantum nelumboides]|nr:hypothetical protein [Adiantum nelumboides]